MGGASAELALPDGTSARPLLVQTGDARKTSDHAYSTSAAFEVEEYQRPDFEVTLDPPKNAFRYGEEAKVTGA